MRYSSPAPGQSGGEALGRARLAVKSTARTFGVARYLRLAPLDASRRLERIHFLPVPTERGPALDRSRARRRLPRLASDLQDIDTPGRERSEAVELAPRADSGLCSEEGRALHQEGKPLDERAALTPTLCWVATGARRQLVRAHLPEQPETEAEAVV